MTRRQPLGILFATAAALLPGIASAVEDVAGKPVPDGIGFQRPVTPIAHDIVWLEGMLTLIMAGIVVFVVGLMGYACWRFSKKNNPTPSKFSHNTTIEVIWTAVPVLILVIIAVPSLRLLFNQLEVPEADVTIKAIGNQWYWDYEYQDHDISFSAIMLQKDELEEFGYQPDEYLLATDERMIVPVNKVVHMLITGADVIHAWTIPSFGSKVDAVPGRTNETWFMAEEEGVYFGQCSEICGPQHAYMPITVEVVSEEAYEAWVNEQLAKNGKGETSVADASTVTE